MRGRMTTFSLLTELIPWSPVPVVASGGIAEGRGLAAALALGAWRVEQGAISLEILLVILMLGVEVFRPLRDLRSLLLSR